VRFLVLILFFGCQTLVESPVETPDFNAMMEQAYSNAWVETLIPRSPADSILWMGYQVDRFKDLDGKQYYRFSYIECHKITLQHWVAFWYDERWNPSKIEDKSRLIKY
jgi:hypothetical protein